MVAETIWHTIQNQTTYREKNNIPQTHSYRDLKRFGESIFSKFQINSPIVFDSYTSHGLSSFTYTTKEIMFSKLKICPASLLGNVFPMLQIFDGSRDFPPPNN